MTNTIKAMTAAALMTFAAVPASFAMDAEVNAVTGAVYNTLNTMQMDLANIDSLTLKDIRKIQSIIHSGDNDSEKRNKINSVLRAAAAR